MVTPDFTDLEQLPAPKLSRSNSNVSIVSENRVRSDFAKKIAMMGFELDVAEFAAAKV